MADQLAIAIENARLYNRVRRHAAELEERVAERTAELAAVNKELEAFAYSVSHDLRAPLRSIGGFSQALLEDYESELDAEGQDYLRRVVAASQHMGQLIDDLLQLSRLTRREMRREQVDLSALARSVATRLREAEPHRPVEFVIAERVFARGDERLLTVVLENLLGNAWKFTSRRPEARIEFGVTSHEGQAAYYVGDNGAGFDMAYADRLFRPFQRLHSEADFEGTGIGLTTVQRVVHRHGGRVWASAKPDQGSTFYFTLAATGERQNEGLHLPPAQDRPDMYI
jgi:light-regulated signal transduction histidine kinase (bacteriophytochrome)